MPVEGGTHMGHFNLESIKVKAGQYSDYACKIHGRNTSLLSCKRLSFYYAHPLWYQDLSDLAESIGLF